jgi:hypothetical protein
MTTKTETRTIPSQPVDAQALAQAASALSIAALRLARAASSVTSRRKG